MVKFAFDAGRWTPAESWRTIRTVRADPPAELRGVLRGERLVVFQTALEQAQQQFAAAGLIGYESRPLNLFYGLSQAGRALAAASRDLRLNHPVEANRRWESVSHGLDFKPTGELPSFWEQSVTIDPSGRDTFSRASIALDSPFSVVGDVQLGALVSQLPEFTIEWRKFRGWPRALSDNGMSLNQKPPLFTTSYDGELTVEAVLAEFAPYPALRDLDVLTGDEGLPVRDRNDHVSLIVPEERVATGGPYRRRLSGGGTYVGSAYILPAAGAAARPFHPLMTWWTLLYAFSMLARYHPKRWTEALNLTTSKYASQIEFLLDMAVTTVPEMLARELWESPWED